MNLKNEAVKFIHLPLVANHKHLSLYLTKKKVYEFQFTNMKQLNQLSDSIKHEQVTNVLW